MKSFNSGFKPILPCPLGSIYRIYAPIRAVYIYTAAALILLIEIEKRIGIAANSKSALEAI